MSRPNLSLTDPRQLIIATARHLENHLPQRKTWKNQKISDAEVIAVGLVRIWFGHPYLYSWWMIVRAFFPHYPSFTQIYTRMIRLRHIIEDLSKRKRSCDIVIVDSQPIPVAKFIRRDTCRFAGATSGYGTQGRVYGFKLHAMASPSGEVLDYRLRPANESDYKVAMTMKRGHTFGDALFIGDKAYQSDDFVTPPKKRVKKPSKWKPEFAPIRKRIETVFSQLTRAHIRLGQTSSFPALFTRVSLTILAHNLAIWGINP